MRIIICIFVARINKEALGKFDKYKIDLKGMQADSCKYEFVLDNLSLLTLMARKYKRAK